MKVLEIAIINKDKLPNNEVKLQREIATTQKVFCGFCLKKLCDLGMEEMLIY